MTQQSRVVINVSLIQVWDLDGYQVKHDIVNCFSRKTKRKCHNLKGPFGDFIGRVNVQKSMWCNHPVVQKWYPDRIRPVDIGFVHMTHRGRSGHFVKKLKSSKSSAHLWDQLLNHSQLSKLTVNVLWTAKFLLNFVTATFYRQTSWLSFIAKAKPVEGLLLKEKQDLQHHIWKLLFTTVSLSKSLYS